MTATRTIQTAQWIRTMHREMSELVVADDSETILGLLVLALTREGFEQIREHRPKLVILDAMMPNGDGYDVCRALNEDPAIERPYVIMLSAAGQDSHRRRALDLGVDEFITKPFSTSELRKRVREILRP
jgi:DNA-binding response OmpR family regulator